MARPSSVITSREHLVTAERVAGYGLRSCCVAKMILRAVYARPLDDDERR